LILFLPSITWIHKKSLMQVSQRYTKNANDTQTTKFCSSQEYTTQLMKLKYGIVWLNQLGLKIGAHILQPKWWNSCVVFFPLAIATNCPTMVV
jgi:hypothetical protein